MADLRLPKTWTMIDKTADRYRVKSTARATESAYSEGESGLVIGHCKAIIEGMCKSILDEHGKEYESDIKVGKLAKQAVSAFELGKGLENEKKAREAFKKLITSFASNLETAVQGIGEIRNDFCPLAHGKSTSHIPLDMHYAEFIASQTDSIIGFISELRQSYLVMEPDNPIVRDSEFDTFLDDEFDSVTIYENTYLPSEILFNVSPEIYQETLDEHQASLEEVN